MLQKYVRARVTDMKGIDIGLYDYDRHFSIYFFAVSPDEQIYLRYGGRDARSPDSYLDLDSLVLALEAGLAEHERWKRGELPKRERPAPKFPRDIETLRKAEMTGQRCVECHMISDYEVMEKEAAGTLDKPRDMFRSPDIRNIGIHLNVPKGLVVDTVAGAAAEAGMLAGDAIVAIEGSPVLTFGDFLHVYDQLDRSSHELSLTVERRQSASARAARVELQLELPPLWWAHDLKHRRWSVDPVTYFDSEPLSAERKSALGLKPQGFACEVTAVKSWAPVLHTHTLEVGDVIVSVDGVETDPLATSCSLYIQLRVRAGDSVTLGVIRNGERIDTALNTHRQNFRKILRSKRE